jgi:uncharacterized protein (TIGR00369 family)
MNEVHFKNLEEVYHSAKINRIPYRNMNLEVRHGKAILTYPVSPEFFHGMEALHGSVYFKLLDDAAFFAVNSLVEEVFVLTTSFSIDLLRPVKSGTLRAVGEVRFSSKNLWVADARLFDEKNREVATGRGRFAASKIKIPT